MILARENQPGTTFISPQWPYPTGTRNSQFAETCRVCMYGETAYNGSARYRKLFSVGNRFRLIRLLEVWIPGTVNVFRQRQVSVLPRSRLRQVSLCYKRVKNYGLRLQKLFHAVFTFVQLLQGLLITKKMGSVYLKKMNRVVRIDLGQTGRTGRKVENVDGSGSGSCSGRASVLTVLNSRILVLDHEV